MKCTELAGRPGDQWAAPLGSDSHGALLGYGDGTGWNGVRGDERKRGRWREKGGGGKEKICLKWLE